MESSKPLRVVLDIIYVILECFKFSNLLLHAVGDLIDWIGRAGDGFKVVSENCEEFLEYNTASAHVFQNYFHVTGFVENFLNLCKVPAFDGRFALDRHFSFLEPLLPSIEHLNALFDDSNSFMRLVLLENVL